MDRRASALGIDTEGLVRTEQEIAGMMQQAQQEALASQMGPSVINAVSKQMENVDG